MTRCMRSRASLVLPAMLIAGALACSREAASPRVVLLFAPCSVNKAFLSPYAADVDFTPNLARFAAEGLVFERHQTESGLSGVAYASLVSGRQALGHGVYTQPQPIEDSLTLIAEAFASGGYETWSFHRHGMAGLWLEYEQGVPPEQRTHRSLLADDPDFAALLDGLASDPSRRLFISSFFEVSHWPYETSWLGPFCERYPARCSAVGDLARDVLPLLALYKEMHGLLSYNFPEAQAEIGLSEEEFDRYVAAVELLYASNIWELDRRFGAVLDALSDRGLLDESLIAFTSDHGEQMYRPNALLQWTHGHTLAPEVLGIALVVRGPSTGVPAGRYEAVTRSMDVYPTLLGLAGVPAPPDAGTKGLDLASAIRGEAQPPRLTAFSHTALVRSSLYRPKRRWKVFESISPGMKPRLMWVSSRIDDRVFKLRGIGGGRFVREAFDLASDPEERHDIYDAGDPAHRERIEALAAYKESLVADFEARRSRGFPRVPVETQQELLRELGYIE